MPDHQQSSPSGLRVFSIHKHRGCGRKIYCTTGLFRNGTTAGIYLSICISKLICMSFVTFEFPKFKANSGAGGFSQRSSCSLLWCRTSIQTRVHVSCPKYTLSRPFLYSSPKKHPFSSEFIFINRKGAAYILCPPNSSTRKYRGAHPSWMKSTPIHTLWAQYCSPINLASN
jgi:hypothetical protein